MKSRSVYNISILTIFIFQFNNISLLGQEENHLDSALRETIYNYGYKGWYNVEYNKNLDTAEYYLKKALELQYANYSVYDDRMATNHISLASVYRRFYNNDKALYHLNKAEEILKEYDPDSYLFGNIYNNEGNIIAASNDVYRTKQYYEYALDFLKKIGYGESENYSHIFSNYIKLLFELGEYNLAQEQLNNVNVKNLKLKPYVEFRFNLIFANSFSSLGQYEKARTYFDRANELLKSEVISDDNISRIIYYYNLIDFYIDYGEYRNAHNVISKAFAYIESLNPQSVKYKTTYYSNILYRKSYILYLEGKYDMALENVRRGINSLSNFFQRLSLGQSNLGVRTSNTSVLPELHILKSRILHSIYVQDHKLNSLLASFNAYQEAIDYLNSLKLSMQNEYSKLYATSQILEVYNEAIYVGKLLYDLTNEVKYLEKAFQFAENSKSFALYSEIKDVEAIEFADLPSDIKKKEERIIGEIQGYEELFYEEQLKSIPDSNQIAIYKEKLFHLNADYTDLLQEIELNNVQYFHMKYKPRFVAATEVQSKLPYRDALIEYVLTDSLLITFVIDKDNINVFSQDIEPDFPDKCLEYYRLIHAQNFSDGVHENYRSFVSLGREFYQLLVAPCLKYTDKENLTIVPDGAITYLPFETFLTGIADSEYINYLDLPYLIRDYSIGYSHSSTLLFSERLKTKSPENKVLAFAPDYRDPQFTYDTLAFRQIMDESKLLLPLYGTINEVQSIKETVPSRVFLNERATELNFKKHASDYSVLHLAMHTIMRDDDPLYSMLAFTNLETNDTAEDNRLYAYEIYNLKLNAQMAVLSSCSSGFGKMQKGEGMMSLARGFFYAGCPSIVMTLWQVSDQSSSDLMTSFYRYLKKGKSKQEAMRLAKIDYLETADDLTSNPYFWSAFVVVGDGSPIYRKSGITYWIVIITVFVTILVFFQYRYKRSR